MTHLEKLSKEQKILLYEALQERKRRAKQRREVYQPNEGQLEIHKSGKRLRFAFAGNGSGKTASLVQEAYWAATGYNPVLKATSKVPADVIVVLDKPEKIEQQWLPELQKWFNIKPEQLEKKGKPYYSQINFENGSTLRFMFHQQEPMAFEGIEVDFVVFDEPPPRHIFTGLMRGGRKKGRECKFLLGGTPISSAWLRTEIYEPWSRNELPDCDCFKFGTRVNLKNLSDSYEENFGRYLTEKEKRIRFEGEFFDLEGLALSHLFKRDKHIEKEGFKPDPSWPCVVAVDPHTSKPHTACLLGVDRDNNYHYINELSIKCSAREFAKHLKEFMKGRRVTDIIGDSAGKAEMTSGEGFKSFFQVMHEEGIRIRETSYHDKSDEDFINRIQDVLYIEDETQPPKIKIATHCKGIISDIENVQWIRIRNSDTLKPKLDIQNKDFLAALKYALAANLTIKTQKDKIYYRSKPVSSYGQPSKKSLFGKLKITGGTRRGGRRKTTRTR